VADPRESKGCAVKDEDNPDPFIAFFAKDGVVEWTLAMLHLFYNWTASGAGSTSIAGE
jgi:hypothetical protein